MTLSAATVWEYQAGGNNLNGGGFVTGASGTDYSQQTAPHLSITDLVSDGADNTKVSSALTPFDAQDVGNIIQITGAGTGFTLGWYQVIAVVGAVATLDRSCGGTGLSGGTARLGGCMALPLTTTVAQIIAGNKVYIKLGTYTLTGGLTFPNGTAISPITVMGYNLTRGDQPTGTNRPIIVGGANSPVFGNYNKISNIRGSTTGIYGLLGGNFSTFFNCDGANTSGTADRWGLSIANYSCFTLCSGSSTNGYGISLGAGAMYGCYTYSSIYGVSCLGITVILNSIIRGSTAGIKTTDTSLLGFTCIGNTIYGAETPAGTGISFPVGAIYGVVWINNNIIYGWATGISLDPILNNVFEDYNDFFNNTNDVVNLTKGPNDLALNPQFVDAPNGDFRIGANLKGKGFPGAFSGAAATCIGYLDIGAVQRIEPGVGGYPAVGDVEAGVIFGGSSEFTGTFGVPAITNVKNGIGYGASGTEFGGTHVCMGYEGPLVNGYTITEIEDAIIAVLKASAMNIYCKKIDSFQIEGGDLEEQIRIFAGQLPCVLVAYTGGPFTHQMSGIQDKEMIFSIIVCAQSMRGGGESRRGTIGTYKMMDDLRSILTYKTCGLDIFPLMPVGDAAEINTKMFSAYSMEFKTGTRYVL